MHTKTADALPKIRTIDTYRLPSFDFRKETVKTKPFNHKFHHG